MTELEKVIKGLENLQDSIATNRMPDAHKAIGIISDALDLLKEDCHNCKLECLLQKYDELKEKYDELLKEQDYRGWLMDMFHKYGRDDLIALLVLHGEENLLADVLKKQEETELCDRCGRRRLKSNREGR